MRKPALNFFHGEEFYTNGGTVFWKTPEKGQYMAK